MGKEGKKDISVNINTADGNELTKIPGIGPELASRIVAARPYQTIDELQRVSGISTVFIERIAPYVMLTSTSLDETDVQQLEGGSEGVLEVPTESLKTEVEDESEEVLEPVEEEEVPEEATLPAEEHEVFEEEEAVPPQAAPIIEKKVSPKPRTQVVTFSRSQVIWLAAGSIFVTLILALLLTLGILAGVNGGRLRYASPAQISALTVRVDGLKSAIDSNAQDLASLRKRVDNLDSLSGRVSTVEQSVDEISASTEAASIKIDELSQKADVLTDQIETMQQQNDRFSDFFSGLMDLMNNLFSSEEGTK